jgi:hypothetical protein
VALGLLGGCQLVGIGEDRASSPATTTAPPMADYAARVGDNAARARDALDLVAGADSYTDLQTQVAAAVSTLKYISATMRNFLSLPEGTKAAHDRLGAALGELAWAVENAAAAVEDQELCTPSSVLARLDRGGITGRLDAAAQELSAVTGGQVKTTAVIPAAKPAGRRPTNGKVLRGRLSGPSSNTITIDNKDADDSVLTLAKGKGGRQPVLSIFVKRKSKVTLRGIPNGSFTTYTTDGRGWDAKARGFSTGCSFWKFKGKAGWGVAPHFYTGWDYVFGDDSDRDFESESESVAPADSVRP